MKREKGITLAVLIITIILMVILASVSISIGTDSLDSTRLKGFYTQLEIIQKRVDDIATTNESYIDKNGDTIYLKEKGLAYADFKDKQKTLLTDEILPNEIPEVTFESLNLRYFTKNDLEQYLDLSDMDYNVFIDFDNRIIIAEDGIKIGDTTYHVLKNTTYFVKQDTEKNVVKSLGYTATQYRTDKCKVIVTAINAAGDAVGGGYVKYKKTSTKYWEVSDNTEIIIEASVEYNIVYIDANNNKSEEKTIKVDVDSNSGEATVTEI